MTPRRGALRAVKQRRISAAHHKFSVRGGILRALRGSFAGLFFDGDAAGADRAADLLSAAYGVDALEAFLEPRPQASPA